jgi:hypothetical protein
MQSNFENQLIKYMISDGYDKTMDIQDVVTNFDEIKHIILDKFEDMTGCKLYNKPQLIKDIESIIKTDQSKLINGSIEAINKNVVPEITFNSMFKSNLDFTLVFKDDEIIVLYKNKKIELKNLIDIRTELLTNKLNDLPVISELYVNNILIVIEKLINKDIYVKYHLTNFPIPYWNLFEIKCKKSNSYFTNQLEKYKHLDAIISGKIYQPDTSSHAVQIINQTEDSDPELKAILIQIEEFEKKEVSKKNYDVAKKNFTDKELKDRDEYHRMEIMSYLNDMDVIYFLEKLEHIDKVELTLQTTEYDDITNHIQLLLEFVSGAPNKMIKYYMVNKMFNFIMKINDFLINHKKFRDTVSHKINELQEDLYVIQSTGLDFSKEIVNTLENCKKFIDEIEKSQNPDYNFKWNNSNQQDILNPIANKSNVENNNNIISNDIINDEENDFDIVD